MASEAKRGAVRLATNYGRLFSTLLIGLLEVPLQIYWLGTEGFGLIGLLGPTIGLTAILQDMVTRSMVRELGVAYHAGDDAKFRAVTNACWVIALVAAAISAGLFAALTFLVVPALSMPPELIGPAQWYTACGGIMSCCLIIFTPTANMYMVSERFVLQNTWIVGRRLCFFVSAIALLLLMGRSDVPASIRAFGILSSALVIVLLLLSVALMWKSDRRTIPRPWKADRATLREIRGTFGWNSLVTFALNVADKLPQLIVNLFIGLDANAAYALAKRLAAYARMITVGATFGLEAVSTRVATAKDNAGEKLKSLLKHSTRLHTFVAMPAGIAIAVLAEPVLHYWAGAQMPEDRRHIIPLGAIIVQILAVSMVARGISEGWMRLLYGAGFVKNYAGTVVYSSIATPLLTWAIIAALGGNHPVSVYIPAIVYTVLFVASYMIILPVKGASAMGAGLGEFVWPMSRPILVSVAAALPLVAYWFLPDELRTGAAGLAVLGVTVGMYCTGYAAGSWFFVLTAEERRKVVGIIRRRGRRDPAVLRNPSIEAPEGETDAQPTSAARRSRRRNDAPDFNLPDF
ncbi:MAG: oligosaccharide flippase family protein [Phycisphaeraceae bacterium]|nr:oligosaccharide flippase family protein [Phycisphaeraceae bacterium]